MNVEQMLSQGGVGFEVLRHDPTYGGQRLAQSVAVSGSLVAKTVLLQVDGAMVLAVLPATHLIDLDEVKATFRAETVALSTEEEFDEWFPDCELGALPPFGSQYGMLTLVDDGLSEDEMIVFEGNKHDEAICMRFVDYQNLEDPVVASFAYYG